FAANLQCGTQSDFRESPAVLVFLQRGFRLDLQRSKGELRNFRHAGESAHVTRRYGRNKEMLRRPDTRLSEEFRRGAETDWPGHAVRCNHPRPRSRALYSDFVFVTRVHGSPTRRELRRAGGAFFYAAAAWAFSPDSFRITIVEPLVTISILFLKSVIVRVTVSREMPTTWEISSCVRPRLKRLP